MEFLTRFDKSLTLEELKDALADWQRDIEKELTIAINAKHATLAIPQVTIDAAHSSYNFATADRTTIQTGLCIQNSASKSGGTLTTAVSYTGRGVLTKVYQADFTSGTTAYSSGLKITIDGNVVFDDGNFLARQSSIRVLLGSLVVGNSTPNALSVVDDAIGLPFNSSCLIEYISDGTRTTTVVWNIAKKL